MLSCVKEVRRRFEVMTVSCSHASPKVPSQVGSSLPDGAATGESLGNAGSNQSVAQVPAGWHVVEPMILSSAWLKYWYLL